MTGMLSNPASGEVSAKIEFGTPLEYSGLHIYEEEIQAEKV
jgi:hypothetical protein